MIRLGLLAVAFAICAAIAGAELYGAAWLAAYGMALACRHPWITVCAAIASLAANPYVTATARLRREAWRKEWKGTSN